MWNQLAQCLRRMKLDAVYGALVSHISKKKPPSLTIIQ
jgi:hypothetical protein